MSTTDDLPKRLMLQISRSEAQERIQLQIQKGYSMLEKRISSINGLNGLRDKRRSWDDYNKELLRAIVNIDKFYLEYIEDIHEPLITRVGESIEIFRSALREQILRLESIHQRLELLPEAPSENPLPKEPVENPSHRQREIGNRVFIVHGHDEGAKYAVARFIQQLGLEAIILQEQSEQGRTIIEKFEDYADVDFAVVLLTPDDVGASQTSKDVLQPRARQNVILELGFFIGKLGRKHVCALYKGDVERPSDVSGVLWTLMDDHDAWQFKLAREMKQAGLEIDMNKLSG